MGLKVVATPVTGGTLAFVIADGENRRGPGGRMAVDGQGGAILSGSFDAAVQPRLALRGTQVEYLDRGLESGEMACSVQYEFSTGGEAWQFLKQVQSKCPRLANVAITFGSTTVTIPNVSLRPLRWRFIGEVALQIDYPLRFGLI